MSLTRINEMHLYVTSKCNLRCVYCSDNDTDASSPENPFDEHRNRQEIRRIPIFAHSQRDRMIVVFHGGEPTLQNLQWYHELIGHIEERAHQFEKQFELTMQSNCLHLTDPFLDLIAKKNIQVGTSLDGPPHLNDLTRANGTKVLANILKLKEAERLGGVISVVTKHNCRQVPEMLQFFQAHGLNTVSFNICYSVGGARLLVPLTADEIFRVFTDTYGYLKTTGGKNVVERFVSIMMKKFIQPPNKEAYPETSTVIRRSAMPAFVPLFVMKAAFYIHAAVRIRRNSGSDRSTRLTRITM